MLAAVVRGAGDAMGIIDDTGLIRFVDVFGARHFGMTAEELIGTNFVDLTHPDDLERNIEMMVTSAEEGEGGEWFSPPVLTRVRHRDGTYRYVSVTGSVWPGPTTGCSSRSCCARPTTSWPAPTGRSLQPRAWAGATPNWRTDRSEPSRLSS